MDNLRSEIDEIDWSILELIKKRTGLVREIGLLKKGKGLGIVDSKREEEIYKRIKSFCEEEGLNFIDVQQIFEELISYSKKVQENL